MRMSFDATSRKKSATNRHHSDRSLSSSTLEQTSVFFVSKPSWSCRETGPCRFFWLVFWTSAQKTHTRKNTRQSFLVAFRSVKLRKACRNIICAWMHGSMQMIHLCSYNILKIEKHSAYQIPALLPNMAATKNGCFAGRFRQKCTVPASFQLFGGSR